MNFRFVGCGHGATRMSQHVATRFAIGSADHEKGSFEKSFSAKMSFAGLSMPMLPAASKSRIFLGNSCPGPKPTWFGVMLQAGSFIGRVRTCPCISPDTSLPPMPAPHAPVQGRTWNSVKAGWVGRVVHWAFLVVYWLQRWCRRMSSFALWYDRYPTSPSVGSSEARN